ncbi:unnamed protein product [Rotaria sp. Silwood2]|nr:unnamed protein product [Rotaria sp. Silwood2]CAF2943087.1 unnamed protein product [Rotaria sp. Silwood2]CAF3331745.1 unnamed protein product [Rotaria sp. Silwood2]CAF4362817.1 unnamed protein product [Rotaria sp. Silwood2]CAF4365680.1 unnamed protein product [Rotaria sp. Silwood2]
MNRHVTSCYSSINHICTKSSPIDTQLRLLPLDTLFDSNIYLDNTTTENDKNQISNKVQIVSPSSVMVTTYSNPPFNQTSRIADHDRSYTTYGDLDRQAVVMLCQFNLQASPSSSRLTHNNLAWNEYIKKSLNFLEYGQFQTIKTRRHQQRPSSSSVLTTTTTTSSIRISFDKNQSLILKIKTNVRKQTEERRKHNNRKTEQRIKRAQTSIVLKDEPMDKIHTYQ